MTAPVLQIRNKNGGDWSVHAEFPDGSFEEISGFKTENEANEWIAQELQDRRCSGPSGVTALSGSRVIYASI